MCRPNVRAMRFLFPIISSVIFLPHCSLKLPQGAFTFTLHLQETYSLSVLMYAIPALLLTTRQVDELNACWNNVICSLFGYKKWESVSALLLSLERLNVKHLIMLRKINFYKRLLYSSDVFIHNMFCTFFV